MAHYIVYHIQFLVLPRICTQFYNFCLTVIAMLMCFQHGCIFVWP